MQINTFKSTIRQSRLDGISNRIPLHFMDKSSIFIFFITHYDLLYEYFMHKTMIKKPLTSNVMKTQRYYKLIKVSLQLESSILSPV